MSLHEKGFWTRQEARGLDQSRRDNRASPVLVGRPARVHRCEDRELAPNLSPSRTESPPLKEKQFRAEDRVTTRARALKGHQYHGCNTPHCGNRAGRWRTTTFVATGPNNIVRCFGSRREAGIGAKQIAFCTRPSPFWAPRRGRFGVRFAVQTKDPS
jgi:hypothetical protein